MNTLLNCPAFKNSKKCYITFNFENTPMWQLVKLMQPIEITLFMSILAGKKRFFWELYHYFNLIFFYNFRKILSMSDFCDFFEPLGWSNCCDKVTPSEFFSGHSFNLLRSEFSLNYSLTYQVKWMRYHIPDIWLNLSLRKLISNHWISFLCFDIELREREGHYNDILDNLVA